jgi:hypothetical protein
MKDLLKKFENKEPVIVLIGKMPKQKLKAGLLSTLRGGAAGGGTRMRRTGHQ